MSRSARAPTPAVGDEVRVPADARNEHARYGHPPAREGARDPLDGIIAAILEIATGERVKVAAGDPRRYVFDLLHNHTFDPRVSSKLNSEGATAGRVQDSPAYRQVQRALRERAGAAVSRLSAEDQLGQQPFSSLLDGWRLVRVCTSRLEVKETAEE